MVTTKQESLLGGEREIPGRPQARGGLPQAFPVSQAGRGEVVEGVRVVEFVEGCGDEVEWVWLQ